MFSSQQRAEAPYDDPVAARLQHGQTRAPFLRYLGWMLLLPALLYPLAFFIATRPHYEQWATSQWGPMLEYAFNTHGENADVVIFGDSSAFLGIDPRVIHAELGLRSIVLPDTVGSIPVTGDKPLRNYLQFNRAPRVLVLYFSAWNLDFDNVTQARLFEGEEMMLRHMSAREIAQFAWRHPTELLVFPFRFFSTFGPKMIHAALHGVNREETTAKALGHVDFTEPFPPLTAGCSLPQNFLDHTGVASVQELVRRFSTPGTQVIVYLAPVPGCSNTAQLLGRSYAAVDAAPPVVLPPSSFAGDVYYAHMEPKSVPVASTLLAAAIRQRLATTNPTRGAGPPAKASTTSARP